MGRICKNDITDHLRAHFGANPLRVPEARIQPMCMLEIRNRRQNYLGEFRYLVKDGFDHDLPVKTDAVAPVSDTQSKSVDFKAGFSILSGFLKALGIDPAPVTASITGAKKMAFSFSDVKRKSIDPLQLGMVLSQNALFGDTNNMILQPALTDEDIKLGLITDVIVSNNFSLSVSNQADGAVEVDVPKIAKAVADLNLNVKVSKSSDNQVKFEGTEDLTFAFTCLELRIEQNTGRFSRGDWMKNIKSATGQPRSFEDLQQGEEGELNKLLLDDDDENVLLIDL